MAGVFCWLRFLCREVIADGHLVRRQLTEQAQAAAVVALQESRLSGTQRMVQVALECGVAPDDLDGMVECLLGLGYDRDYVVVMMPPYPFAWNGACHWMYDWDEVVSWSLSA